jgi:hypothetical protein
MMVLSKLIPFLSGVSMMAFSVSALIFLGYWRKARDPFFALFSLAFGLLALERVIAVTAPPFEVNDPSLYFVRLLAFLAILAAIWQKNRNSRLP